MMEKPEEFNGILEDFLKEVAAEQVAVRVRGGQDLGQMPVDEFIRRLRSELPVGV